MWAVERERGVRTRAANVKFFMFNHRATNPHLPPWEIRVIVLDICDLASKFLMWTNIRRGHEDTMGNGYLLILT